MRLVGGVIGEVSGRSCGGSFAGAVGCGELVVCGRSFRWELVGIVGRGVVSGRSLGVDSGRGLGGDSGRSLGGNSGGMISHEMIATDIFY